MRPPYSPPIRSASVLLPTWQAMEFLDRVLDALALQDAALPFDLVVADSDSTDGTVERLTERAPHLPFQVRVIRIRGREFDHGDTRNLLAARSTGDLLVYLTQDAIPTNSGWLRTLVSHFDDESVGAASCRNVPRSDASLSARVFSRDDPGYAAPSQRRELPASQEAAAALTPDERRALYDFQNVASAVRRSLWERFPFPRTMMGEDVLMARGLIEAGWATYYSGEATVDHSHDYGPDKLRWRGTVDARFNAEWLNRICVNEPHDQAILVERVAAIDAEALAHLAPEKAGDEDTLTDLRALHTALVQGLYEGGLSAKRYAQSAMLDSPHVRVLLLSDAPLDPAGAAGSWRMGYPAALGRELLDLGHDVRLAVLDPELAGSASLPGQVGGVRAVRCGHPAALDGVMEAFQPQVIHLLASTRAAVRALRRWVPSNRPTMITLLDHNAVPLRGSELHGALGHVDRVLAPTQSWVTALEGTQLDQHRLELSTPGLLAKLPARLRGASPAPAKKDARLEVAIIGDPGPHREGVVDFLAERHPLRWLPLEGSAEPGASLTDRLERLKECSCAVLASDPASVAGLMATLEAREAELPCIVPTDSAAAEAGWHDPAVHAVEWSASSVADAVQRALTKPELQAPAPRPREIPIKTLREDARDMEVRYRTLAAVDREDPGGHTTLRSHAGTELTVTDGETLEQGGGRRVLFPGAAAALSLGEVEGPIWIKLRQTALGGETFDLGGCIEVDGEVIGWVPLSAPVAETQEISSCVSCWLPPMAERLTIRAASESGAPVHVRIDRVTLSRRGICRPGSAGTSGSARPEDDQETSRPRRVAPSLLERSEALSVPAPEPLAASALPKVALIIPTLDGLELLRACLRSLQDVVYPHSQLQIIVVDNGSSDGTAAWLQSGYPGVHVIEEPQNRGFAAACNLGVNAAGDAEVVAFVNNDMRFDPAFLVELVTPIASRTCDATTAKRLSWDGTKLDGAGVGTTFLGIAVQPGFGEPVGPEHELHRRTLFPCGGAMAMRREVFEDLDGFDEDFFAYYEDLDLGWRMWVAGYSVHYVPSAVVEHHHSHTSKRFSPERVRRMVIRNSLLACLKNYDEANLQKILPAMTALAIERAFLKSDLDLSAFDPVHGALAGPGETPDAASLSIHGIGAADLVALHDVFGRWDRVMKKRRRVQAMRQREDAEIFSMFLDPLACVEGDASYRELQNGMVRWLGLDRLFEGA